MQANDSKGSNNWELVLKNNWFSISIPKCDGDDLLLTNAGPGWYRGLADPEWDPGENHQESWGNICFQDKEQHVSAQCKMQH